MKKRKRSLPFILATALLAVTFSGILLIISAYFFVRRNIDYSRDEIMFSSLQGGSGTKFYYNEGEDYTEYIPRELCVYSVGGLKQNWVSYADISENIKIAFISAEDRKFFEHRGVDFKRTALAFFNYIFKTKPKFGGSTITQQVIKNASGDNDNTVYRKISEILRALHTEDIHSKEEIFELYMNIVPMGDGIIGVGMASEYYFGKSADDLSIEEAATIVGITNAPSKYNPYRNPELCTRKRNNVLYAMLECGHFDYEEYERLCKVKLDIKDKSLNVDKFDSWFIETVLEDASLGLSTNLGITKNAARVLLTNGGLSVYTTIDPHIQSILDDYFSDYDNFPAAVKDGLNYSMAITDSKSGYLVAVAGGAGKKEGNRLLNNATVPHTPGSVLKPLAIYAPLLNEKRINWATVIDDVPQSFESDSFGNISVYPKNSPNVYDGFMTVAEAVCRSKNTVAVNLCNKYGIKNTFENLRRSYGFSTLVEKERASNGGYLTDSALSPMALGQLTRGISIRELTEAYSVFPSEGVLRRSVSYLRVTDRDGKVLIDNIKSEKRILDSKCARIMNRLLMGVVDDGTAKAVTLSHIIDTAGKTGTSGNDADRLFVGYTPYYTAGIWCGYNSGSKSIGRQEISHLAIWDDVMKAVHENKLSNIDYIEGFSTNGLEYLPFCKDSGNMFCHKCLLDPRGSRLEYGYFTSDNKPEGICERHIPCYYDTLSDTVVQEGSKSDGIILISLIDVGERALPPGVSVTDEEYVYREIENDKKYKDDKEISFYYYTPREEDYSMRRRNRRALFRASAAS